MQKASEEFEVGGFMAQKGLRNIAIKRVPCPEKTETCSGNAKRCTKKTFSAVGCGRTWKVKKKGRERMNREATEEESKRVKRERWREKGKGLRLTAKVSNLSESFVPFLRWSVWGNSLDFLCAHASLPWCLCGDCSSLGCECGL